MSVEQVMFPVMAPGVAIPGNSFMWMQKKLGGTAELVKGPGGIQLVGDTAQLDALYRRVLYSKGDCSIKQILKGQNMANLRVVSGHRWGSNVATGPVRSDVMVIGKMLGEQEVAQKLNQIGESGSLLREVATSLESEDVVNQWYVTNVLKTSHPKGPGNSTLTEAWLKDWKAILDHEIRLVRPKFILCLGADASKLLLGKSASVGWMEGRVVDYRIRLNRDLSEEPRFHDCLVMTVIHPAAVLAAPEVEDKFRQGLTRFVQLTRGLRWDKEEEGLDHRTVDTLDGVRQLAAEIASDIEDNMLSFDAEWHGQHPQNAGSYLRTVQLSWRHKTAACIMLRGQGGQRIHSARAEKEIMKIIKRLCQGRQLIAHFGVADLEFLAGKGLDLSPEYLNVPEDWETYMRDCLAGKACGFDTGTAAHSISETDDFGLTAQALKHTSAPRYDIKLTDWKKEFCKEHKLKDSELEGYGECPDEILVPYGCYDADVTRRIAVVQKKLLNGDLFGNNCWEAFWISMRALPIVLEINVTGMYLDKARTDELTTTYLLARDQLEDDIRTWARWPDFNVNSVYQVREFLFGEHLNGVELAPGEKVRRLRPKGARSLWLQPIMTTDKRPMLWPEVEKKKLVGEKTPSTNKLALSLLAQEAQAVERELHGRRYKIDFSPQVSKLRDFRFISQVLKSSLRPPLLATDDDEEDLRSYRKGPDGHYVYGGGWAAAVCDDGKVRTHMYPTKETARWASARPPAQNFSKRRETDYARILKEKYSHPLRSIVRSAPGLVLVEADYIGAELYGMAIMSGDRQLIEHAKRNQLPENHPDYYDIHSNVAKLAFRLDCPPTKAGLKAIGKKNLRVAAKNVIFGIAYGRQAKAIALGVKEEGVNITVEEAQMIIDTIFEMYPGLQPFFAACQARAGGERWMCNCFGRFRRLPVARDFKTLGEFERQLMNVPIQSMIADAVNRACDHLYTYRRTLESGDDFWFNVLLQIHDAMLFQTEPKHVPRLIDEVLPLCMAQKVPIYPTTLDGVPRDDADAPYFLGIDVEVATHWGELMYPEECLELGIDPKYSGWQPEQGGWMHKTEKEGHVWRDADWHKLAV